MSNNKIINLNGGADCWYTETPIAHRGLHDTGAPENSLAAFAKAAEAGYPFETDIQLLADGQVVVFHDGNAERMTGVNLDLYKCKYADIKDLRLAGTEEKIPLLSDMLKAIDGKTPVLIEFKLYGKTKIDALCSYAMRALKNYKGAYAIHAFNPFVLKWFRQNYPDIKRGQLSSYFRGEKLPRYQKFLLKHLLFNRSARPDFISYEAAALPNHIVKRVRKHIPVLAWTVRGKDERERVKPYCDNIIFENFTP